MSAHHTGFSVSRFCGSFFLETLFSALLNSVVVSAALMSFCRSWAFFSRSFFLVSIFLSSWMRYSSSATYRKKMISTQKESASKSAYKYKSNCKVTNLFRCANEQLFQLLLTAPFMAGIKDVDFGFCSWCSTDFGQLTTNIIISFFQVLHRTFLKKYFRTNTCFNSPNCIFF